MLRILRAARNTWNGLIFASRSEEAFRQELVLLVIATPLAFFVATDAWRRLMLIGVLLFVMVTELLNTAIEKLSDHVMPDHHAAIGHIKDMASAAVGMSLLLAGLVWLFAIAERFALI